MKKEEKTQIKKWKKKITIDTVELKNKIREYYEKIYAYKFTT